MSSGSQNPSPSAASRTPKFLPVLKEILICSSLRIPMAENQTRTLILQVAALQCKLNSQCLSVFCSREDIDWEGLLPPDILGAPAVTSTIR